MDRNLVQRISVVVVAVPVAALLVYQGGVALALALAAVGALGAREVFSLARQGGVEAVRGLGLVSAAAPSLVAYGVLSGGPMRQVGARVWIVVAALLVLLILTWVLITRRPEQKPLAAAAVTLFGMVYAGALPAFLLVMRHAHAGPRSWPGVALVFFPLVIVWVCDSAAMFGGRAIGGPKLAPTVSPGKTRSGALAGVAGAVAVVPLYQAMVLRPAGIDMVWWHGLLFGGILGVVGQIGDLVESLLKREAGVKDSSALIPGHGGLLDRLDSLYFALPVATMLYLSFGVL
jgi:phosphatidate cytidylyltransferase